MLFSWELLYMYFITVKFSLNMQKKKSGGSKRSELLEFGITDSAFSIDFLSAPKHKKNQILFSTINAMWHLQKKQQTFQKSQKYYYLVSCNWNILTTPFKLLVFPIKFYRIFEASLFQNLITCVAHHCNCLQYLYWRQLQFSTHN